MDSEIYFNGSGIKDPTAYKAIMEVDDMELLSEYKRGEIYEFDPDNSIRKESYALVISADFRCKERVISVIILSDNTRSINDVLINCRGVKYAAPSGVQYTFSDKIGNFVRSATREEMDEVDKQISRYLGLNHCNDVVTEVKNEDPVSSSPMDHTAMIEAITEARVYKQLCDRLLSELRRE